MRVYSNLTWMLSIPTRRAICPHSIRRYHNFTNMSASSSSSIKRKRDHPGDNSPQGAPQPDAKVPKRVSPLSLRSSFTNSLPFFGPPQSFPSSKVAEWETKGQTRRRSPSGGSRPPSVRRAVVCMASISPRARPSASRRSISMAPSSSRPIPKRVGAGAANSAW